MAQNDEADPTEQVLGTRPESHVHRPRTTGDPQRKLPSSAVPPIATVVKVRRLHTVDGAGAERSDGAQEDVPEVAPPATRRRSFLVWCSQELTLRRLIG